MTSRPHISLSPALLLIAALLFSLPALAAEALTSADDYFHGGAMRYLTNNVPGALDIVTNGLQKFPNDEKLKKLEELLKQQQQQQQQNQQDQQQDQKKSDDQKQKDQQNKDQQSKKDDKQKEQDKKDQQKSDEQKEKDKQDQQKKNQQQKPEEQKKPEEQQQQQQAAAQKGEQMTPEQAMRVLDTTKGDEKVLPIQMQKPPQSDKKLKDW